MTTKFETPKYGDSIIATLQDAGFPSYYVGGCVRDSLLGREPKDWDIATTATPTEVKAHFDKVIPTGEKHGTVTVLVGAMPFEVTTFRTDGDYSDGRRPDVVHFVRDINEDLSRRDFTINAMAYDPFTQKIIDPFGGMQDIEKEMIRCVGEPKERYTEDALRMLRAIRFSSQLDMGIEGRTLIKIQHCKDLIKNVSVERIRDELVKMLLSPTPDTALGTLAMTELLDYILPELVACVGFSQHSKRHRKDVFDHILDVVVHTKPKLELRLAALLHDIAKPVTFTQGEDGEGHFYGHDEKGAEMARVILNRLRFDNATITRVVKLVEHHMKRYSKLRSASVKRFMNQVGIDYLDDLFALMRADCASMKEPDFTEVDYLEGEVRKVLEAEEAFSMKDLAINGRDLIEMGYKPGPALGHLLNMALGAVLDNQVMNMKAPLQRYVLSIAIPQEAMDLARTDSSV